MLERIYDKILKNEEVVDTRIRMKLNKVQNSENTPKKEEMVTLLSIKQTLSNCITDRE